MGSRLDEADDDEIVDDQAQASEKKRRLTPQQVKYLETNFESENKLGPERKALIARHLGLRPRQVAIWFQNRRARWKNKQLEQDFESLKEKYDSLLQENEKVVKESEVVMEENRRLQAEVARMMAVLQNSEDLHGSLEPTKESNDEQKVQQHLEDGSLVTVKSELTSPTKSEDQSEVQDSGRSYPTPAEGLVVSEDEQGGVVVAADMDDANMKIHSCPVVKLEDQAALVTSEDLFGNLFNPLLFHRLAANGVCLEEACGYLCGWDDQFPGISWY